MIDTDKYTGHTPGPWLWREATYAHAVVEDRPCHQGFDSCYDDDCIHWAVAENIHDRATGLLIADAPLLLEEVKRLREELFDTHAFYSIMEQKLAFAVGVKQGLLTNMTMDDLVDSMNRDYHDRLNEHMDGRLRK